MLAAPSVEPNTKYAKLPMAAAFSCRRYRRAVADAMELFIIRDYLSQANCGRSASFSLSKDKCVNHGKNLESALTSPSYLDSCAGGDTSFPW